MVNNTQLADSSEQRFSLQDMLAVIKRRRATLLIVFLATLALGAVVTLLTKPTYQATAQLLVEEPKNNTDTVDTSNPLSDLLDVGQQPSLDSHAKLLSSDEMMQNLATLLGVPEQRLPKITVEAIKDTDIVTVSAEDRSPQRAADVVETLIRLYLNDLQTSRQQDLKKAQRFTSQEAVKAQTNLVNADKAQRDFNQLHHVADLEQNRDAQLKMVEGLRTEIESNGITLNANSTEIDSVRRQLSQEPTIVSPVVSAAADPAVQLLEDKIAALQAQRDGLARQYGPHFYKRAPLEAQIKTLQAQLVLKQQTVKARNARPNTSYILMQSRLIGLMTQGTVSKERAADLQSRLIAAQKKLDLYSSWAVTLAQLQRQEDLAKTNYQLLSQKREDLKLRVQTPHLNIREFAPAMALPQPVRPKRLQNLLFAAVLGLCFAWAIALLQEMLDDNMRSPEEAIRLLRLPVIGLIPHLSQPLPGPREIVPMSPLAEAYRSLSISVSLAARAGGNGAPTLLVTAAAKGEGCSTTAAYLAAVSALDGKRILLVDANLRDAALHEIFDVAPSPGLSDYLRGAATLNSILRPTGIPGIFLVPAGTKTTNPAALLHSEQMTNFLAEIRRYADLTLLDGPPTVGSVDSMMLAEQTDGVLLVVGFGNARKTTAQQTLDSLARAGAHIFGVALNESPPNSARLAFQGKVAPLAMRALPIPSSALDEPNVFPALNRLNAESTYPSDTRRQGNYSSNRAPLAPFSSGSSAAYADYLNADDPRKDKDTLITRRVPIAQELVEDRAPAAVSPRRSGFKKRAKETSEL